MAQTKEIITKLRKKFNENSRKKRNINFPRDIKLQHLNYTELLMEICGDGVLKNMQTDSSAFEGWMLVLRHWTEYDKFILKWTPPGPDKRNTLHYQRFLYRVYKFNELFDFFRIDQNNKVSMEELKIDFNNAKEKYILNIPTVRRVEKLSKEDQKVTNKENILEIRFVNYHNESLINAAELLSVNKMDRQLSVGLFKTKVKDDDQYRIFSGRSSAIDIWGIGKDNKTLKIFELKKIDNIKVGVISELFLYTMIMEDTINGRFEYNKGSKSKLDPRIEICKSGLDKINSYILAPELHPLITEDVLAPLNNALQIRNITFGFISFEGNDLLTCTKKW